jgi:hypothetical protein
MSEAKVVIEPRAEFSAIVLRCGCGDPDSHSKLDPPQPCPNPCVVEDLGIIASPEE